MNINILEIKEIKARQQQRIFRQILRHVSVILDNMMN